MTRPTDVRRADGPKITRRSLVRGAAWAVPAVVVATAAPAFAASTPPPTTTPTFVSSAGCGSVGGGGGCAGLKKAPQIPFVVKNTTANPLWFQVTGVKSWQGGTAPTAWSTDFGVGKSFRLFTQNAPSKTNCAPEITSTMTCGGVAILSVQVLPGQTLSLWLVGKEDGAASSFTMAVRSRWVDANCNVVVAETQSSSTLISSGANC